MSDEQKQSLHAAMEDAERMRDLCAGAFERWEIAGSVRRKKAAVSDVDHVVIPKFEDIPSGGLFNEPTSIGRC